VDTRETVVTDNGRAVAIPAAVGEPGLEGSLAACLYAPAIEAELALSAVFSGCASVKTLIT
jgi:hypothetical protein